MATCLESCGLQCVDLVGWNPFIHCSVQTEPCSSHAYDQFSERWGSKRSFCHSVPIERHSSGERPLGGRQNRCRTPHTETDNAHPRRGDATVIQRIDG